MNRCLRLKDKKMDDLFKAKIRGAFQSIGSAHSVPSFEITLPLDAHILRGRSVIATDVPWRFRRMLYEIHFIPIVENPNDRRLKVMQAYGLTTAECDVIQRLSEGATPSEIAAVRNVSIDTVRVQMRSMKIKLHVSKASQLSSFFLRS